MFVHIFSTRSIGCTYLSLDTDVSWMYIVQRMYVQLFIGTYYYTIENLYDSFHCFEREKSLPLITLPSGSFGPFMVDMQDNSESYLRPKLQGLLGAGCSHLVTHIGRDEL